MNVISIAYPIGIANIRKNQRSEEYLVEVTSIGLMGRCLHWLRLPRQCVPTGKIPNFAKTLSNPFNARLATERPFINVSHENEHNTGYVANTILLLETEYVYRWTLIDDWCLLSGRAGGELNRPK